MDPPSYEESIDGGGEVTHEETPDSKAMQRFSIREEVSVSRSQHVVAVVAKLLPHIQARARGGLSTSTLLLLPSDQSKCPRVSMRFLRTDQPSDCSRRGELVGYGEDEAPILIQLEGTQDTLEFWRQSEALELLQNQILNAISETVQRPATATPLPARELPARSTSFFGRKTNKAPEIQATPKPVKAPVTVEVRLDDVFFRAENQYGLYQTLAGRAVVLTVEVT